MPGLTFLRQIGGIYTEIFGLQTSAGAGDAGKIPALDAGGRFDSSMMPTGVAPDTESIVASENLTAGDYVNIHVSSGTKVRKADASSTGKEAVGFVLANVTAPAAAQVFFEGRNTAVSGKTPGARQFLSATTPGATTETAPSGSPKILQYLGVATSATTINTEIDQITELA